MAETRRVAARLQCLAWAIGVSLTMTALAACSGTTIAPQPGIVSLDSSPSSSQAPSSPDVSGDPGWEGVPEGRAADTPLCLSMLEGLPIMDDTGLDPSRASFFIAWGRYMKDVDRYLAQRIPALEAMVARAPDDEWLAQQDAMEGVLRMQSSVHAAASRMLDATDPVDDAVVRVFTVASSDFLDGLGEACPSSQVTDAAGQDMGLSMM